MKYLKRILCVIILAALLASFTVYAADSYITLNGFMFDINKNGYAVIHEYVGEETDVVIPDTLLGAKVLTIDDYAFFENTEIKSVSFENASQLSSIGTDAFYGCTSLKSVVIPGSVTSLGFGVFQNCAGLEKVKIENGLTTIPSQAFLGCSSLVDVEVPDSVTDITSNAFDYCPDVVIYCNEGSYAESYARENNNSFDLIDKYKYGDVNLDRDINIRDVTTIQLYRVGRLPSLPTYRGICYGDVIGDGKVTIRDATIIQLYLAGKGNPGRIGKSPYDL